MGGKADNATVRMPLEVGVPRGILPSPPASPPAPRTPMPRQQIVSRDLRKIKTDFLRLARAFGRLGPSLRTVVEVGTRPAVPVKKSSGRRPPQLSQEQKKALVLQGRYMGTLRGLKTAQQVRVKKIRAQKGIRAAIAAASKMAG